MGKGTAVAAVWTRSWEAGCGWLCLVRGLDRVTSVSPCQPRLFYEGKLRSSGVGRGKDSVRRKAVEMQRGQCRGMKVL